MDVNHTHIDHIIPLAAGGNNEADNLQLICIPCHQQKTRKEQENQEYVKTSATESSFNSRTLDIITSHLASACSFAQTFEEVSQELKQILGKIKWCKKKTMMKKWILKIGKDYKKAT